MGDLGFHKPMVSLILKSMKDAIERRVIAWGLQTYWDLDIPFSALKAEKSEKNDAIIVIYLDLSQIRITENQTEGYNTGRDPSTVKVDTYYFSGNRLPIVELDTVKNKTYRYLAGKKKEFSRMSGAYNGFTMYDEYPNLLSRAIDDSILIKAVR